jgi:predicted acylesterase/phospholipase RssA
MPITHLLLGGGGASGFEILGILHGFQWNGMARTITHLSSISIGTLFAAFFMMDVDMVRVRQRIEAFSLDPRNLYISAAEILRMPYTYALYDSDKLIEPIKEFMHKKWPDVQAETMTHAEFCKRCGRDWAIVMSNLQTSKPTCARPSDFGDIPVLDLIRASMALPLFMRPVQINNTYYVDGGLCCDNPALAYADDPPLPEHVCAVIIQAFSNSGNESNQGNPLQSIGHYLQSLFACGLWPNSSFLLPHTCGHIIKIEETTMPVLPVRITNKGLWLDITPEKIETAFIKGMGLCETLMLKPAS